LKLYGLLPLVQPYLTQINWVLLAFILMPLWPVAARLHLRLYRRSLKAIRTLKLWKLLRRDEIPWDELANEQIELATLLDNLGQKLVLPGDKEWTEPPTGIDDFSIVHLR
jgi:hypothetical protein